MKINGLLIDCSRLLEPRAYYHRLLDFMAEWGMNTLVLHFSDDYGCALKLRGFESLALPHAFTMDELGKLLAHARSRGIDVIPELEAFGHTRYITDTPRYRHLFAGRRTRTLRFNAIDPLHKDTFTLMRRLIRSVAQAFPSRYLHLGCDEVDLAGYCRQKGLAAPDLVWADYVNRMTDIAREAGKVPMIWADHVVKSDAVADRLRKDVVLVEWRYWEDRNDDILPRLRRFGFADVLVAPALASYHHRFFATGEALQNTTQMLAVGRRHRARGLINTVWCPWRYLQNALYYGIAYSAEAVGAGRPPAMEKFNRKFARRVFGTGLPAALKTFLAAWPGLAFDVSLSRQMLQARPRLSSQDLRRLRLLRRKGAEALRAARDYAPQTNPDIWHAMVLSAQCAWLCAESLLLRHMPVAAGRRKAAYNQLRAAVCAGMEAEWNRTRDPDDPQKLKPRFPGDEYQYAMILVKKLPYIR